MLRRNRTNKPAPTLPNPANHKQILAYPNSHWRKLNLAYLGTPRPGFAPDNYQLPAGYRIPVKYMAPR
ncbi:hypothetical protein [Streptomyces lydicus]|uniref:hypothetical protein n=1 Tax=Streptomyces lydicus TaxID=47763 RepID=UPI0036F073A2